MALCLILGGARSGKSSFAMRAAESYAAETLTTPLLIATAEALDEEMTVRISQHRAARSKSWRVIEEPVEIAAKIQDSSESGAPIVVDCLTLWISNLMMRERPLGTAMDDLLQAIAAQPREIILVANEVGLGIVPEHALGRHFRDEAGRANQRLAAHADTVFFMIEGLPMTVIAL